MSDTSCSITRALLSVSDKTGLVDFAQALSSYGVELVSTGGTRQTLTEAGLTVKDVSEMTGFPEMMDGRVKTLHPHVHGGLLARRNDAKHIDAMKTHGIGAIDLLVVNLYPFEATIARGADTETCIENIDIGGPAMIRAAAKNHADVAVIVDPADYQTLLEQFKEHQKAITNLPMRRQLAQKAYARTASYDAAISNWMAQEHGDDTTTERTFRAVGGTLRESLRYGENPHQSAAFYATGEKRYGVTTAKQIQGKQLSYNNINDTDAAFELVCEFDPTRTAAVAIIKHANPCGVAEGATLREAYDRALACDPVSAFGGIIALNQALDVLTAQKIMEIFTEVIIAPDASDEAKALLASKKNVRLLLSGGIADPRQAGLSIRTVTGGFLAQSRDNAVIDDMSLTVVTKRTPSDQEYKDLIFAFRVAKHVKSNAIVYAKNSATVGIGAGQMSRIDSSRIAAWKAGEAATVLGHTESLAKGSVVASDAFFPFADGLIAAAQAGATAVIQPGGSMRDDEVIRAADEANLAMVFTGHRHFKH